MQATYEILAAAAVEQRTGAFARDVLNGLSRSPKSIPSMYFYDAEGSRLFQRITELDEYYLTRCEQEILETHGSRIAEAIGERSFRLMELGVGDGRKTEVLLRQFLAAGLNLEYNPIDICRQTVLDVTSTLRRRLPHASLRMHGMVAEYFDALDMLRRNSGRRNLVLFLGSSIGNFAQHGTRRFLRGLRSSLNAGDFALLGFDLKKDLGVLHRAYNDSAGVTRAFNFNLLKRVNRELGGEFDLSRFTHHGAYNARQECMESWLVSTEEQHIPIGALGRSFSFRAWEGIRLECSYKYDLSTIADLAAGAGFRVRQNFLDSRGYFVNSLWQAGE